MHVPSSCADHERRWEARGLLEKRQLETALNFLLCSPAGPHVQATWEAKGLPAVSALALANARDLVPLIRCVAAVL